RRLFRHVTLSLYQALRIFLATIADSVVGQFAVAALSERRNSLRIQDRRSETAATKRKLTHYRRFSKLSTVDCLLDSALSLSVALVLAERYSDQFDQRPTPPAF